MRKFHPLILVFLGLGLGFVLFNQSAARQAEMAPEAALASGFTYQGRLTLQDGVADGAANGIYDFEFRLYDAATDGSQVGGTVSMADVTVSDGLFSVMLDFGEAPFSGEARWLEIAVREGNSTGGYTYLSPRQQLSATPYALHAMEAGSVSWGDVQGRPAGLDDGDDDTTYTAGAGLVLNGNEFAGQGSAFGNVVVVAKSGGDFTSVQAALDSITDAGADNPYLVTVAPGVYEEQVTLKPHVTVEGAGEDVTIVRWTGGSQAPWEGDGSATVRGADHAALRHLTVESDGTGQAFAVGVLSIDADTMLRHVTARAWDASDNRGVANYAGSAVLVQNVTALGSGGDHSHGVVNDGSPLVIMRDVRAEASGGSINYGVINWHTGSPEMFDVAARATGAANSNYGIYNNGSFPNVNGGIVRATGANTNRGIYNWNGSSAVIQGVRIFALGGVNTFGVHNVDSAAWLLEITISAAGGSSTNRGVYNQNSPAVMNNVTAVAFGGSLTTGVLNRNSTPELMNVRAAGVGGSLTNYGLYNDGAATEVRHSKLEGATNSVFMNGGSATVAYSELVGPVTSGLMCLGNYDQSLSAVVCP